MADYSGEYGHPYPRVDQYGNPVPPVDQYGNPIPREPDQTTPYSSGGIGTTPPYCSTGDVAAGYAVAPADYGTASAVGDGLAGAHEGVVSGVVSPDGAAYTQEVPVTGGGVVAPDATTTYAYESMVGSGIGAAAGDQIQPTREEHTTLGETLRPSGSSSSSSSEEDNGRGRRKKSIKEKIKEKLPGSHKQHEAAGTGTHAAGPHEKKGIMEKIKEKLPGHH